MTFKLGKNIKPGQKIKMRFSGCAHLDYRDNFRGAKKQAMGNGKVFWLRDVTPDLPQMVQFCEKRGRLNFPESCLDDCSARCSEYLETEHVVEVSDA